MITYNLVPPELIRLNPSTVLVDDPISRTKRTHFEIDQQRMKTLLLRTPKAAVNRYLSGKSHELSSEDQHQFRETGNNALVCNIKTLNSLIITFF